MDQLLLLIITSLLKGRVEKEIEDIYKSTIQQQQKNIFCIILYKSKRNILKQPCTIGADPQPIHSTDVGCIFSKFD